MQSLFQRLALAAIAASLVVFVGCGDDGDDDSSAGSSGASAEVADVPFVDSPESRVATVGDLPEPKEEDLTIGLLAPVLSNESVSEVFGSAKAQVEELGGTAVLHDANLDPDTQVSKLQDLIAQDVDAIAFIPIAPPELLGPVIGQAAEKRIPVIAMDAAPGDVGPLPGFTSEVWQRRDYLVYLQVKAAAEELGRGAKVGQIGLVTPAPLFEFAEPRTEYWAKQFGLDIVAKVESPNDTVEGGQRAAAGLLANHPEIEGVLGYQDEAAIGAALAARASGRDDLKTFGVAAGPLGVSAIEAGRLTASVHVDTAEYGRVGAIVAYLAAQGVKLPPEVLAGEPIIVTEENLDDVQD